MHLRMSSERLRTSFHYSVDGRVWHLVRVFGSLSSEGAPLVGFSAQCPTGKGGCLAKFDAVTYSESSLTDLRNGT